MNYSILTVEIRFDQDVVLARQRARQIASLLGFETREQTQIATAVSEVIRQLRIDSPHGKVEFIVTEQAPQLLLITVSALEAKIETAFWQNQRQAIGPEGIGGLVGARRLMDGMQVQGSADQGAIVQLVKQLPKSSLPLAGSQLAQRVEKLVSQTPQDPFVEVQQQNQELLRTLEELRQRQEELHQRQDELAQLNQELEDTNRGVVALYAELNDKAEALQRVNELKTRFLSHISHEFRTPLNAILSLARMLLGRLDGDLTSEQEKQVTFIHKSAESLTDLVNDLLDLAKVEAGKVSVNVSEFTIEDLFKALRGMLRPLVTHNATVHLVFADPIALPKLTTDEGKVSQILRNFISNALKYTEQGEVRISARLDSPQTIVFAVADTGIGIAPADLDRIFQEFVQIEHPLQRHVKGTGLGLPLCKHLAELLGGRVEVQSTLGQGSVFSVHLPIVYSHPSQPDAGSPAVPPSAPATPAPVTAPLPPPESRPVPDAARVLIIDDEEISRYTIRNLLTALSCTVLEATDGHDGLQRARREQPQAIVLDLSMPGLTGFAVVDALKRDPTTATIPIIIMTSTQLAAAESEELMAVAVDILSKTNQSRSQAMTQLQDALIKAGVIQKRRQYEQQF